MKQVSKRFSAAQTLPDFYMLDLVRILHLSVCVISGTRRQPIGKDYTKRNTALCPLIEKKQIEFIKELKFFLVKLNLM